ncbi:MAG: hypothetical protein AAF903_09160 [Pseudomonadota bacterium]
MRVRRPRLIRPSYFVWVLPFAASFALHAALGWPHLLVQWERNSALSECGYLGPTGGYVRSYARSNCPWFFWTKGLDRREGEAGFSFSKYAQSSTATFYTASIRKPKPWCNGTPRQVLRLANIYASEAFQHFQYALFADRSFSNLRITMIARLQLQTVSLNVGIKREPEPFIIHGFEPVLQFIQISELFHGPTISNRGPVAQKLNAKALLS